METTISAIGHTCGMACWAAKEDVCRCSCGGRNHGILRNGDESLERTMHRKSKVYRLVAITTYGEADRLVCDDYGSWLDKVGYGGATSLMGYSGQRYPHERLIQAKAQPNALKWPEVINAGISEPYLVWERMDAPKTW